MKQVGANAQNGRLEAALKTGYFIGLMEDRANELRQYYRWCVANNKPYVYAIRLGRKYAVVLDTASYESTVFKLSEEAKLQVKRLWRTLLPYGCEYSCGGESAEIYNVPSEHVESVCQAFVAIVQYFKEDWEGHRVITRIIREIGGDD